VGGCTGGPGHLRTRARAALQRGLMHAQWPWPTAAPPHRDGFGRPGAWGTLFGLRPRSS
jgi:hypothetical protein